MFSKVDFKKYAERRKAHYDFLEAFQIDNSQISEPISIDSSFVGKLNSYLQFYLEKRVTGPKFSREENKDFKRLLMEHCPEVMPVFEHRGPCIYWFKINHSGSSTNSSIIEHYYRVKQNGTGWWTKVNLANADSRTQVLYLGKIESGFQNRFIQHIGLGHDFTTALKLQRWMPDDVSFSFQFFKLDVVMKPYLEDIEKVMWDECRPLLGESPRIKN